MGKPARPDVMIREQEQFAAQAVELLRTLTAPTNEATAGESLARLQYAADALVISLQVRWQNAIGDHTEVARRVVAITRDAVAVQRQFPGALSAFPFNRAAWIVYLLDGVFDDDINAQFPMPAELSRCSIDYPLPLADACLLHWIRTQRPHPEWADFLAGRFRRKLPTAHLCETYQAYSAAVAAIFAADQEAFAGAVADAERLYDKRWRISYAVPDGGMVMNPKARGRDLRLAALLEFARQVRPDWQAVCDASSHRWIAASVPRTAARKQRKG